MKELYNLYDTVMRRKAEPEEGSYTAYLFDKGLDKILKKVGEECTEVIIAAMKESDEDLINELNDLFYHLLVLMAERNITIEDVENVMIERNRKEHNLKPERKPIEIL